MSTESSASDASPAEQTEHLESAEDDTAVVELSSAGSVDQQAYDELNNRYLRLAADFENFRKRQATEREHLLKYGAEQTMMSVLPVLDNLKLAKKNLNEDSKPDMLYKSFEMMATQLLDSLKQAGLEKIPTDSRPFDPQLHEALSFIETKDFAEGTIVETYKDGFMLHDRVIRAAQVVVSKQPDGTETDTQDTTPEDAASDPTS